MQSESLRLLRKGEGGKDAAMELAQKDIPNRFILNML